MIGVFVLGVDGMDPDILARLMREGKTPELAELAQRGGFQPLATVWPPQSPVAWSSFATGLDPGGHGVYDFIHRDPETYAAISSATRPTSTTPRTLSVGGYHLPISSVEAENSRGGATWWDLLTAAGVDTEVYRVPGNFPVPPSEAKVLSGMGTVDLRGGYGTYTLWTDTPFPASNPKGDIQLVSVSDLDGDGTPESASGILRGPPDVFRLPPGAVPATGDLLGARLTFHVDPENDAVVIEGAGDPILLAEGEWSGWAKVGYDLLPYGLSPVAGMVRFYARQIRPEFQLYASPVNVAPDDPVMPVASPGGFAEELAAAMGPYYTQGMPENTDALKDGALTDDEYLAQVGLVQRDTRDMLDLALSRFDPGDATFFYVSDIDLQCHMLWRHGDPKDPNAPPHPAYEAAIGPAHAGDIERFYKDVDRLVGEVRDRLPPDTLLLVMSDHGFQPFTRRVHLNAWLRDNGYLALTLEGGVDWAKTRAYAVGFNSLYLNRAGREGRGIVSDADAGSLTDEISGKLLAWTDDDRGGKRVIRRVAEASDVYHGARVSEAPDLIVGYDAGYGASDATALGEIGESQIFDNTERWSGNHLMDPEVVPGVLLSSRPLPRTGYSLLDLTVTLLDHYRVPPAEGMAGRPLFKP